MNYMKIGNIMKTNPLKKRIEKIISILNENRPHFTNKRPFELATLRARDFITISEHNQGLKL